jgi:hypothetical protein
MKRTFGTALTRWPRGSVLLSNSESCVLDTLVSELPSHLWQIVDAPFRAYMFVQPEPDGRVLRNC